KRLALLKEAGRKAARIAVLASGSLASSDQMKEARKVAGALKIKVVPIEVREADYDRAFVTIIAERADAVFVVSGPTFLRDRSQVVERLTKHRLPSISGSPKLVQLASLLSYGGGNLSSTRRAAVYVDKILKGAQPSILPVEQPTKFELAINLKTAKALGLTLSQSLLDRADTLIR